MKKIIGLMILLSLVCNLQAMAFNEDKFRATLEKLNRVLMPAASASAGEPAAAMSGKKGGNAASDDFVWLKADKVNQQLDVLIRGIETAKGVATALAVIINLYESDKISVDVAFTAIQILKLRAVFLKVFVTNGDTELEVMIHILNEHEADFSDKVKTSAGKTSVNIGAQGKIKNPVANP